mgnify:CR=1 FL=1
MIFKKYTSINYRDVTDEWLNNKELKKFNITHARKYVDDDGNEYIVDNNNKGTYFDKKSKDYIETKKCAKLFKNVFGGKIQLQPIVNAEQGISTCDFKWKRKKDLDFEKWDLKTVEGNSNRTLDNMIKNKKRQSDNFIFDIKNNTITEEEAKEQIKHIYNDPHRNWIKIIILKSNTKIIAIYQKNEKPSS